MRLCRVLVGVLVCSSFGLAPSGGDVAQAEVIATVDIVGPVGSGRFGERVVVLMNGNFVVVDPQFDGVSQPDVGAVYLYDGMTNGLISMLQGSSADDRVGSSGLSVVNETNFVVRSPSWDNGAAVDAGALTWVNGTTGLNGTVGPSNSLVGSTLNDQIGSGGIASLSNGNYVITSQGWDNGAVVDAGAVTWGNGSTGVAGAITAANSFVGTTSGDGSGMSVTTISNGNYVIRAPSWDNVGVVDVGAATFANGATGIVGTFSPANSLVGTLPGDGVGTGVTALMVTNNYVVRSPLWNNGGIPDVGAATWANGTTGLTGPVTAANSLIGATASDQVGTGVTALSNGNYVVRAPLWNNGAVVDAGAATWRNGTINGAGTVTAANSIVGSTANDQVGAAVSALQVNGNYVVRAPTWDNGAIVDAGAVTFANGATGSTGVVSAANSLVGTHAGDTICNIGMLTMANGNYVVFSPSWNNGAIPVAGAITWGSGTTGVTGAVSAANSFVGATANDAIGNGAGGTLENGNVVFFSPTWDNGAVVDAGAVTWVNGATGGSGVVGPGNSLVGSTMNDAFGSSSVTFLTNGNYVVGTPTWDNGALVDVGAVTWGNGATGTSGVVSAASSMIGTRAMDRIGVSFSALEDGNYVAHSPLWDNGAIVDAGAATWRSGVGPTTGSVTSGNSLVGVTTGDSIGNGGAIALPDGDYLVRSFLSDNGATVDAGAATYGDAGGLVGVVSATNSVRGATPAGGPTLVTPPGYTAAHAVAVGRPLENVVTLLVLPAPVVPTTTTTTLPPPADCAATPGIAGLQCLCGRGLGGGLCAAATLPRKLTTGHAKGCDLIARAAADTGKKQTRLLGKALRRLRKLPKAAGKRGVQKKLPPGCGDELVAALTTLRDRTKEQKSAP